MQTIKFIPHYHARQWISTYSKLSIAVPPFEIQQAIVKILDIFTELKTELEARKKQYQYYRDKLLTFDVDSVRGCVKMTTLGKIGTIIRDSGIKKSDFTESGLGCIHYGQIHTYFGVWAKANKSYINPQVASRLRKEKSGDLVIATTSEDDDAFTKDIEWIGVENFAISTDACIFQHLINSKYLLYFFQTECFHKKKKLHIMGTSLRRITGESLTKVPINKPSNKKQERIVSFLDIFDSLLKDLLTGLHAGIKARQQQYEYYQDKLLTFEEAA